MYQAKTERLGLRKVHVVKKGRWYYDQQGKRHQSPVGITLDTKEDAQALARELNKK